MLKVSSVAEEWKIVTESKCDCGGSFEPVLQSLTMPDKRGKVYDIMDCECTKCHKKKSFKFDINSFFWEGGPNLVRP